MLYQVRSEVAPRTAALLAPLLILNAILCGCGTSKPVTPARHYVRLEALMPLHPAWAQIALFDETHARILANRLPGITAPWTEPSLLPPFTPSKSPALSSPDRQKPIVDYTRRYLADQAANLKLRNQVTLTREERAERKHLNVVLAEEKDRLVTQITGQHQAQAHLIEGKIRALDFRDAALLSQVRGYTGQSRIDAQRQRELVASNILALQRQQTAVLADVEPEVNRLLEPRRNALETELQTRMKARKVALDNAAKKLDTEMQDRLLREAAGSGVDSEAIPIVGSAPSVVDAIKLNALSLPSNSAIAGMSGNAQRLVVLASQKEQRVANAQQARLLSLIRRDTETGVQEIARKRGWVLVPRGAANASDATPQVASVMRASWRLGAQ